MQNVWVTVFNHCNNWCLSGLIAATIRNQYDLLCPNNQQPGHTSSYCYCYPIGVTKSSPNGAYDRTSDVRLLWTWRGSSASWDMLSDFGIFWLLDSNVRINYIELYPCNVVIPLHVLLICTSTNLPQEFLNLCKISKIWELVKLRSKSGSLCRKTTVLLGERLFWTFFSTEHYLLHRFFRGLDCTTRDNQVHLGDVCRCNVWQSRVVWWM